MTKVLYISTDGMRPDALSPSRTPNLEAFMRRGAYSLGATSVTPSVTLPCHMSVFHSLPPERHGVTTNTFTPMARPVPGLIEVLSAARLSCASFFSWEPLRDVGRPQGLKHSTYIAYDHDPEESDARLVDQALPHLSAGRFDFTFLYLGAIDEMGHDHGWMSERYLQQVELTDRLVGRLMEALPSDTTVVLHSDHGGHDRNHGTDSPEDTTIPWMITGPGVKRNHEVVDPVSLLDTAPTAAHVLGVAAPAQWEGRVIRDAFVAG